MKVGALIASIGIAYGLTKATLASVVMRVGKMEDRIEKHESVDAASHGDMIDRLARMETKIDFMLERRPRHES